MTPSTDPHNESLGTLQTEAISPIADTMDTMATYELCASFNQEEALVATSIASNLPAIAALVDDIVPRLRRGGRLIYVGAGNSGRVAYMDCTELLPTFSADQKQFLTVVAGGSRAVVEAVEGAEDLHDDGEAKMQELQLTSRDTVIGIAASGRTPFVLGALEAAMRNDALTAGITNCRPSAMEKLGIKHLITVLVGPEFVTGSTRLKAGSCAKQVLNMISTCTMIKLGKTYRGLMVDVRAVNEKLRARGRRIVRQVCKDRPLMRNIKPYIDATSITRCDALDDLDRAIDSLIQTCAGSIKLACAVGLSGLDSETARAKMAMVDGNLHAFVRVVDTHPSAASADVGNREDYFLCVDGGGTKCAAAIASRGAVVAQGVAGGCNLNSVTLEEAVNQIRSAIDQAVALLNGHHQGSWPKFRKVWVGIAGLHHSRQGESMTSHLEYLLGLSSNSGRLSLTCDTSLLSSCMVSNNSVNGCVALIAGTGAVATAFKTGSAGGITQVGRAGGWGHLFGDAGSAFYIGQRAIQTVLAALEECQGDPSSSQTLSQFQQAVLEQLNCDKADLLSTVLGTHATKQSPKLLIGGVARIVTNLGFRSVNPDQDAINILHDAADCLVVLLKRLIKAGVSDPSGSMLVLSGALMKVGPFRELVLEKCKDQNIVFKSTLLVEDPSKYAGNFLARSSSDNEPVLDDTIEDTPASTFYSTSTLLKQEVVV
ncbi:glucokinase regulator family protein [Pochonia chlamydosporia 170]|uniref:N-acetyl-D-glucosamine kinase n=1 Tax=Pochonia chlamydosporia 170 TaxID=1380566 RepID=A0A179FD99_METCM|nr:glucokinase regulator family protein [Pochonia chlamydosporia 170]OAQ63261.1 glucokinase regulator family protein [Pochonia chlamydosporia 170]